MSQSLHVAVEADGVRPALGRERVKALVAAACKAERVDAAMVSITFVDTRTIASLNRRHLGHRGPTDVISFAFAPTPGAAMVGDVYIAPTVAADNARRRGIGVREELARLVVHGVLHVLGWDHPEGDDAERAASPMWRRQEQLVARFRRHWQSTPSAPP
ncbi:MAG: rRNA maturation RNase YbeY [Gemmatimonadaceae bacterium]|jgi:probable rRNA maturation factor|nr:rRNA maturation RNase YbeY [Gemmatimonadaceae bacterium]